MISVKVNGSLEGFFKAGSGLRQGDPMFPYLFVLAMEVLSACLGKLPQHSNFKFHYQTKPLSITHLIFADDILLFCHGDLTSIELLLSRVQVFSNCSGLLINKAKSHCFFSNVDEGTREHIISATGFQIGSLPIKYLGLPLITTKLSYRACIPLIM